MLATEGRYPDIKHIKTHKYTLTRVYTHTHTHTRSCSHKYPHVHPFPIFNTSIHSHAYIHIHIHTHTHHTHTHTCTLTTSHKKFVYTPLIYGKPLHHTHTPRLQQLATWDAQTTIRCGVAPLSRISGMSKTTVKWSSSLEACLVENSRNRKELHEICYIYTCTHRNELPLKEYYR